MTRPPAPLARRAFALVATLAALTLAGTAHAIQTCELDGKPVNPNNGAETAGKTGLLRCRDADSGEIAREQELRDGKYVGIVRYYKKGQLEREYSVDERGNRSGLSREWAIDAAGQRVLVREETNRSSHAIGITRSWYPNGQRRRLTYYGDDEREQAVVEFTNDGKLADLRCGTQPLFGSDYDDKAACGFAGASTVLLYNGRGQVATRIAFERGERRKVESLWDSGAVRESREITTTGTLERSFAADGTKLREIQWVAPAPREGTNTRSRGVKVLDQEFHASGKLIHETRWTPNERGADLASESRWYLNGQPKERTEYTEANGKRLRRETSYYDNGKLASDGSWIIGNVGARSDRTELPTGTHKGYDEDGKVRVERVYDERGRIARERELDASGKVTRDDEVFEDGSRKSLAR